MEEGHRGHGRAAWRTWKNLAWMPCVDEDLHKIIIVKIFVQIIVCCVPHNKLNLTGSLVICRLVNIT